MYIMLCEMSQTQKDTTFFLMWGLEKICTQNVD